MKTGERYRYKKEQFPQFAGYMPLQIELVEYLGEDTWVIWDWISDVDGTLPGVVIFEEYTKIEEAK